LKETDKSPGPPQAEPKKIISGRFKVRKRERGGEKGSGKIGEKRQGKKKMQERGRKGGRKVRKKGEERRQRTKLKNVRKAHVDVC
jgi:hypothetical protein